MKTPPALQSGSAQLIVPALAAAIHHLAFVMAVGGLPKRTLHHAKRSSHQAKSRHLHLGSLGRYVQLGEQTSAQVTADVDPAARRRTH